MYEICFQIQKRSETRKNSNDDLWEFWRIRRTKWKQTNNAVEEKKIMGKSLGCGISQCDMYLFLSLGTQRMSYKKRYIHMYKKLEENH